MIIGRKNNNNNRTHPGMHVQCPVLTDPVSCESLSMLHNVCISCTLLTWIDLCLQNHILAGWFIGLQWFLVKGPLVSTKCRHLHTLGWAIFEHHQSTAHLLKSRDQVAPQTRSAAYESSVFWPRSRGNPHVQQLTSLHVVHSASWVFRAQLFFLPYTRGR